MSVHRCPDCRCTGPRPSEIAAAKLLVAVNERLGRDTSPALLALANTKGRTK